MFKMVNWKKVEMTGEEILEFESNSNIWLKESILKEKQDKINIINNSFNQKIQAFNSSYPIEEQKRFADKLRKAEKVIDWWTDNYITKKAEHFNITPLVFAEWIINKANLFEEFYLESENERDDLIDNL